MSAAHCRYCEGQFSSLYAYDQHLILYKDVENEPWNGYNGRPVCIGQKWGRPVIDPAIESHREKARRNLHKGRKSVPVVRRAQRTGSVGSEATSP